jgi:seryl-tRNA synthetase
MLDPKFVEENFDLVAKNAAAKGYPLSDVQIKIHDFFGFRREMVGKADIYRSARNAASPLMGAAIKAGSPTVELPSELAERMGISANPTVQELQQLLKEKGETIARLEEDASETDALIRQILLTIPNMLHDSVPLGEGEQDNVEVRRWGTPREFDFTPKPHWDIGEATGTLDFDAGAKLGGSRFCVLKGMAARLSRALVNFFLTEAGKLGYHETCVPFLVRPDCMEGTGQLPKFEDDLYKTHDGELYLIPTAEVPLTNLYREQIVDEKDLPLKLTAYTPCFRREAGTYGRDERGLMRQHQFEKVELVRIVPAEESWRHHEELTADAEHILQLLGLPYRVMNLCSKDLSFSAAKCYDLEVWIASEGKYREISSCSNFTDYQARRMGLRYRPAGGGKPKFAHTLNGSALAVGRTIIALYENYQQADGSVLLPEVLGDYLDGNLEIR